MISLSAVVWKMEPLRLQLIAQHGGINQIAVVRDRDLAAETIDHERLRIFQRARAGGGIARVPDRARALQPLQFFRAENLRDQAHVAMQVERCEPGPLLVTMPALSCPRCWSAKRP